MSSTRQTPAQPANDIPRQLRLLLDCVIWSGAPLLQPLEQGVRKAIKLGRPVRVADSYSARLLASRNPVLGDIGMRAAALSAACRRFANPVHIP